MDVEEQWEADRVTFRFPIHPRSRALAVVLFALKWLLAPIVVPVLLFWAAVALVPDPHAFVQLLVAFVTIAILGAMSVAPIFFWPDTERVVSVVVSEHRIQVEDREFWRSEVLVVSVRENRVVVVLKDGNIHRSEHLDGLQGERIQEALIRFTPTHDERMREELAAAAAAAHLDPLRSRQ